VQQQEEEQLVQKSPEGPKPAQVAELVLVLAGPPCVDSKNRSKQIQGF
jgi:hypothetical protein